MKVFRFKSPSFQLIAGLVSFSVVSGCAAQTDAVSTECVVAADQTTSFKGHWTTHPIPLAVVANDFTATELSALQASIETWNAFYQQSKGFQLYLSGSSTLSTISAGSPRMTSSTACSQSLIGPNGFTGKLMIYKTTSGWTYGSQIMALTSLCPVTTANSKYRMFTSAVMEINFQNYFNSGQPVPDLQSIVTHEMGHLLGLDHSCTGTACTTASDDYTSAIMYPSLGFDGIYGRIRRGLQKNDQERANCLY